MELEFEQICPDCGHVAIDLDHDSMLAAAEEGEIDFSDYYDALAHNYLCTECHQTF